MEKIEAVLALPPDEALAALSHMPEDQWFDRKSGRAQARDLAIPLVAMANTEGGYLAVGFHDGEVDGLTPARLNDVRQAALDFTEPAVKVTPVEIRGTEGRTIIVLRIEAGDQVHVTSKGECYLRVGDECRRLTFAQQRELSLDRGTTSFDAQPVDATVEDLSPGLCAEYQERIGSSSVADMLRARDLLTRNGRVTVAGWLLFAERPQSIFPSAHIRVLKYADRERGTGSRMTLLVDHDQRFDGPLPEQISQAMALVAEWIPRLQRLGPTGTFVDMPIIPERAWKEGLINAAVHRSYSISGDHIRVEIFPNRIEISSPGRFPGMADLADPMSIVRYARNPRLVRVLAEMKVTRELGEGIRRMFEDMREAGLVDPVYRQTSMGVVLTLLDQPVPRWARGALDATSQRILAAMRDVDRPLGSGQIAQLTGLSKPTVVRRLKTMRAHGWVDWAGLAPNDPQQTWTARQGLG